MPRASAEDAQPNEARPARKGVHAVPTIRTTRPGGARGLGGNPPFMRSNDAVGRPQRAPMPFAASGFAHKSSGGPSDPHPYGRRPWRPYPAQGANSDRQDSAHYYRNQPQNIRQKPRVETAIFNLPKPCQKGQEGSRHNRVNWAKGKMTALETEPGTRVIGYSYREDKVQFELQRALYSPPQPFSGSPGSSRAWYAPAHHSQLQGATFFPFEIQASSSTVLTALSPHTTDVPLPEVVGSATGDEDHVRNESNAPKLARPDGNCLLSVRKTWSDSPHYPRKSHDRDVLIEAPNAEGSLCGGITSEANGQPTVIPIHSSVRKQNAEFIDLTEDADMKDAIHPSDLSSSQDTDSLGLEGHFLDENSTETQPRNKAHIGQPLHACFSCRSGSLIVKLRCSPRDEAALDGAFVERNTLLKPNPSFTMPQELDISSAPTATFIHQDGSHSKHGLDKDVEIDSDDIWDITGPKFTTTALLGPTQAFALPKYDKPRRLLVMPNLDLLCVTAYGLIDRLECGRERRRRRLLFKGSDYGEVDQACVRSTIGSSDWIILGHARERGEISLLSMDEAQVCRQAVFDRPGIEGKRAGISAISAMLQPSMFATGGYDHRVHLWTIPTDVLRTSPCQLAIKHKSLVQALLPVCDSSHKLITAGADCVVNVWDISSERVINSLNTSNSPYQAHAIDSPSCTLLEVAHRDLQFEIRDHRAASKQPVQRFGYLAPQVHGRYVRGDVKSSSFACGDRDGNVRLWDLRAAEQPCQVIPCFPGSRVLQVVFSGDQIIACSSDYTLTSVNSSSSF